MTLYKHRLDTLTAMWDHLDNATLYVPVKKMKDGTHSVLVVDDVLHKGLYMLRIFLNRDDINEYSLNFKNDTVYAQTMTLETIEHFMKRYTNPFIKNNIRLSRCVLSTIDIDRNIRDLDVIWHIKNN